MAAVADDWMMAHPRDPSAGDRPNWWVGHNRAVTGFRALRVGAMNDLQSTELAILSLAWGIEQWATETHAAGFVDPLTGEWLWSLMEGFRGALDHEIGRLQAGVLADWAFGWLERWGVDPDTGKWVGPA